MEEEELICRCYLTPGILYDVNHWTDWALLPYYLPELIERRNKDGHMTYIHVASIYKENGV
ncbi:hypothetical protein MKX01_025917 [Papaver californicum]|nr:hypothetical protein MKX01_025917 [Papaver californicum]